MAVVFDVFVVLAAMGVVVNSIPVVVDSIGVVVDNIGVVCLKALLLVVVADNIAVGGNVVVSVIGRVFAATVVVVVCIGMDPRRIVLLCNRRIECVLLELLSSESLSKSQLRILC